MSSSTVLVPRSIDDVTPQWLTAALQAHDPSQHLLTVSDVRAERIAQDTGFSALLYRLHLTGSEHLPATLIVKLPGDEMARGAMELLGGYAREVAFYRDVAAAAPLQTARVYAAGIVEGTADFVLVLEDLAGWDNADHLAGLSLERTRLCIDQLAGLHAWSSTAPAAILGQFPSLDTPIARDLFVPAFAPAWQVYRDKTSASVPAAVARFAERFADHAPTALHALTQRSMLLHGDIRADNMFFGPGDALKVVDFQMAALGSGAADVGYLVSQGLPTDARRGNDEELVRRYLDGLTSHGVGDYTFDDAWRHYRFAVAYLMLLPVVILNTWDVMPERSRALCLTLTDRAVAAIDDTDALEVFA